MTYAPPALPDSLEQANTELQLREKAAAEKRASTLGGLADWARTNLNPEAVTGWTHEHQPETYALAGGLGGALAGGASTAVHNARNDPSHHRSVLRSSILGGLSGAALAGGGRLAYDSMGRLAQPGGSAAPSGFVDYTDPRTGQKTKIDLSKIDPEDLKKYRSLTTETAQSATADRAGDAALNTLRRMFAPAMLATDPTDGPDPAAAANLQFTASAAPAGMALDLARNSRNLAATTNPLLTRMRQLLPGRIVQPGNSRNPEQLERGLNKVLGDKTDAFSEGQKGEVARILQSPGEVHRVAETGYSGQAPTHGAATGVLADADVQRIRRLGLEDWKIPGSAADKPVPVYGMRRKLWGLGEDVPIAHPMTKTRLLGRWGGGTAALAGLEWLTRNQLEQTDRSTQLNDLYGRLSQAAPK